RRDQVARGRRVDRQPALRRAQREALLWRARLLHHRRAPGRDRLRGRQRRPRGPSADRCHQSGRGRPRLDPRRLRPGDDLQHGPRLRLRRVGRARDRHLVPRAVLASGSPQRREILGKLGVEFDVVVSGVDELSGGDPNFEVLENARKKAWAVANGEGAPAGEVYVLGTSPSPPTSAFVIACDTDVVLDGKALGKPADEVEAREYLDRMSGRAHEVLSGLVILDGKEERSGLERTSVFFKELSEAEK